MNNKPLNYIKYLLAVTALLFAFSISSVRAAPVFFDYIGADNNASAFGSFSLDDANFVITDTSQSISLTSLLSFSFSFTNTDNSITDIWGLDHLVSTSSIVFDSTIPDVIGASGFTANNGANLLQFAGSGGVSAGDGIGTPLGSIRVENGDWTLRSSIAAPVPAAFWLFGTALIGFVGFSRRTIV